MNALLRVLLFSLCVAACSKRVPPSPQAQAQLRECEALLAAGDYQTARGACQAASKLAPDDARGFEGEGLSLLFLGRAAEAKAPLEQARARDDRQWRTHNGLGIAAFVANDHPAADGFFQRAQALDDKAVQPRFNRAWNFFRWRKYEQARAELRALMKAHPKLGFPYQFYALLMLTEERVPEAMEAMLEALQREPRECRNWLAMANVYDRDRRYLEAEEALRTCIELCPKEAVCGAALEAVEGRSQFPLADPRDLLP